MHLTMRCSCGHCAIMSVQNRANTCFLQGLQYHFLLYLPQSKSLPRFVQSPVHLPAVAVDAASLQCGWVGLQALMDLDPSNNFMFPFFSACVLEVKDENTRIVKGWLQSEGIASSLCAPREVHTLAVPAPAPCSTVFTVFICVFDEWRRCRAAVPDVLPTTVLQCKVTSTATGSDLPRSL